MEQFIASSLFSSLLNNRENSRLAIADVHGCGLTYSQLRDQIRQTHKFLMDVGITPADTVALSLRNGPETAAICLAIVTYCRLAPLNPAYTATEVAFVLRDVNACAIIIAAGAHEQASIPVQCGAILIQLDIAGHRPGAYTLSAADLSKAADVSKKVVLTSQPPPAPADIALLLHTSGTTSRPKLVPLTHANLYLSSQSVASVLRLLPGDRCLSVMPLFHIHGLVAGLLASIVAGASVCCAPPFQAIGFFSWLHSSRATWYTAVPTMHQTILARARHNAPIIGDHRLRFIRSSSAPLYAPVWDQLEKVFGVPVLNSYGMTEAAHQITSVPLPGGGRFHNTVGSSTGLTMAIMDGDGQLLQAGSPGEVVLRGAQITQGYMEPSGANQNAFKNGWFRTGDEGVMNPDGVLTLTGRLKEMINSGGEKISPYEVEEALLLHPGIAQAVAFPMTHHLLGEQVAAAVVMRDGFSVLERELLQVAGQRLARAKLPRRIVFVQEIPPGPTGKMQRIGLAARLGMESAGEAN